jgi:hypothetical protein
MPISSRSIATPKLLFRETIQRRSLFRHEHIGTQRGQPNSLNVIEIDGAKITIARKPGAQSGASSIFSRLNDLVASRTVGRENEDQEPAISLFSAIMKLAKPSSVMAGVGAHGGERLTPPLNGAWKAFVSCWLRRPARKRDAQFRFNVLRSHKKCVPGSHNLLTM